MLRYSPYFSLCPSLSAGRFLFLTGRRPTPRLLPMGRARAAGEPQAAALRCSSLLVFLLAVEPSPVPEFPWPPLHPHVRALLVFYGELAGEEAEEAALHGASIFLCEPAGEQAEGTPVDAPLMGVLCSSSLRSEERRVGKECRL